MSGKNIATIFKEVMIIGVSRPEIRYMAKSRSINAKDWKGCCRGLLHGTLSGWIMFDNAIGNLLIA